MQEIFQMQVISQCFQSLSQIKKITTYKTKPNPTLNTDHLVEVWMQITAFFNRLKVQQNW